MQYGYKNAEFDADFESEEKVTENLVFDFYYCVQNFSPQ